MPVTALPSTKVALPRSLDAKGKRVNMRQHVRITVSFSACVRHATHADEVVECENVSKGGVCFHSLQQYPLDSLIEVAAPFSPGETALFVPAKIKRVETLSGGLVFRYGVEYTKLSYSSFS
jgi:PilZ domain